MSIVTCAWGASIVFGPGVSGEYCAYNYFLVVIIVCVGVIADPVGQYDIPSSKCLCVCVLCVCVCVCVCCVCVLCVVCVCCVCVCVLCCVCVCCVCYYYYY